MFVTSFFCSETFRGTFRKENKFLLFVISVSIQSVSSTTNSQSSPKESSPSPEVSICFHLLACAHVTTPRRNQLALFLPWSALTHHENIILVTICGNFHSDSSLHLFLSDLTAPVTYTLPICNQSRMNAHSFATL